MIKLQLHKALRAGQGPMQLELDLALKPGLLYGLYGKSGVGKTSVLRMIAGLMPPDSGSLKVEGQYWYDSQQKINLKPQKRESGLIFQDYALFPNMSVENNLRFALKKKEDEKLIHDLIELMELGDLRMRRPETLSGGQKQRVAVARALVQRPKLLLLDEPLAALDTEMREKLQEYILKVHREFGLTSILVSHDQKEMNTMADWVFILEAGKVVRQGKPEDLFEVSPKSKDILHQGTVLSLKSIGTTVEVTIDFGTSQQQLIYPATAVPNLSPGDKITILVG